LQYRQLKKQIGRATDELADIDDGGTGDVSGGDTGKSVSGARAIAAERERAARVRESQFRQTGSAVPGAREPGGGAVHDDARDLELGEDGGSDHEERPVPVRSLSEHKADPTKAPTPAPAATSPLHSPGLSVMSSSAGERNSDDTNDSRKPIVRLDSHALNKSPERDDHSTGLPHPFSRKASSSGRDAIAGRSADSRRKWREGFSGNMELDEVIDKSPLQSRRFFALLDRELERVSGFYADREAEASKRYEELSAQWRELASASPSPHELHVVGARKADAPLPARSPQEGVPGVQGARAAPARLRHVPLPQEPAHLAHPRHADGPPHARAPQAAGQGRRGGRGRCASAAAALGRRRR